MGKDIPRKYQKKVVVATLIPDKLDIRAEKIIRDKDKHYIMITFTGSVHTSNNRASEYLK